MSRIKSGVRYLFAILLACSIALLMLEGLVRIWGYAEHNIYDPIYMPYPTSEDIAYVHIPNLASVRARGEIRINTDSYGLRSALPGKIYPEKQPGEIRIAILGDSITFGEGVADFAHTYPAQLETILSQQTGLKITVFNFGVSGYSVRDMVGTLEYRVFSLQPDLVILAIAPQDFTLSRTGAVDPYGYVYNPDSGFLKEHWRLRNLLREIRLTYIFRDLLLYSQPTAPPPASSPVLPASYTYILKYQNLVQTHNVPSLITLLPILYLDESFHQRLIDQFQADNLNLLDLSGLRQQFTQETFAASSFDQHPSALVHEQIAHLLSQSILPEITK